MWEKSINSFKRKTIYVPHRSKNRDTIEIVLRGTIFDEKLR